MTTGRPGDALIVRGRYTDWSRPMTDDRSNEPTEAMILAGLNAYSSKGLELDGYETTEEYPSLEMWGDRFASQMRAALVAAQEAAPQLIGRLDLARHYWRSQGYDYDLHGLDGNNDYEMGLAVADAALAALAAAQGAAPQADEEHFHIWSELPCKPGRCRMEPVPVVPSSGVDEDKLAEEIGRHKLVHVSVSRKSAFCACNPSITAGVDDNRAWFEGHRARAVAEWLKEQGGEIRGE